MFWEISIFDTRRLETAADPMGGKSDLRNRRRSDDVFDIHLCMSDEQLRNSVSLICYENFLLLTFRSVLQDNSGNETVASWQRL